MGRMSGGGPEWKRGPATRQDDRCSRTPRSYVGSPVWFRRITNRTTIVEAGSRRAGPSVDVRRGRLRAVGHELGLIDGHSAGSVNSNPPATQGSAVLRVWRAAGKMVELYVCVDGWLRDATLRRVHRKRLPDSADVENQCGLSHRGDDDRRVWLCLRRVGWLERLHSEPDRITGTAATLREAPWSAAHSAALDLSQLASNPSQIQSGARAPHSKALRAEDQAVISTDETTTITNGNSNRHHPE